MMEAANMTEEHDRREGRARGVSPVGRFLAYGALGWITEVVWTGLGSAFHGDLRLVGHTYLWMFPIYGLALVLERIHDAIRRHPAWIRGLIWMMLIFAIEYSSGWTLKVLTGAVPWDYGPRAVSVGGFIRLDYAPAWFVAGLLFEKIHDALICHEHEVAFGPFGERRRRR